MNEFLDNILDYIIIIFCVGFSIRSTISIRKSHKQIKEGRLMLEHYTIHMKLEQTGLYETACIRFYPKVKAYDHFDVFDTKWPRALSL